LPIEDHVLPREDAVRHQIARVTRARPLGKLARVEIEIAQRADVAVDLEAVPKIVARRQKVHGLRRGRQVIALGIDRVAVARERDVSRPFPLLRARRRGDEKERPSDR